MKILKVTLLFFGWCFSVPNCVHSDTFAVLFTGISHYYSVSYAFEAGVARFYDMMLKRGFPKKNIITMTPNSVAYNRLNPFPGVIMHGTDGDYDNNTVNNYNERVDIDYDPTYMSTNSFFQILAGNDTAAKEVGGGNGRVFKRCNKNLPAKKYRIVFDDTYANVICVPSGPKDYLIVYFTTVTSWGRWIFNLDSYITPNQLVEGFEALMEQKRFGKMQIIFDAQYPGLMFDNFLESTGNIIAYTFGSYYTRLYACQWNEIVYAITGLCSSVAFFETFEKFIKQSNSEKLPVFDLFIEHRKFLSEMDHIDGPNIYGRQELAFQSVETYFGKTQIKRHKRDANSDKKIRKMINHAVEHEKTIKNSILNIYSSSESEKDYLRNVISIIAMKAIEGTQITKSNLDEPVTRLSPKKLKTLEKVGQMVKSACFANMNMLVFASLPSEKLSQAVAMDVSLDKIKVAIDSVCH